MHHADNFAKENQATVDDLVAKNIETKRRDGMHDPQSLRLTGKLLVGEGQIELAHVANQQAHPTMYAPSESAAVLTQTPTDTRTIHSCNRITVSQVNRS